MTEKIVIFDIGGVLGSDMQYTFARDYVTKHDVSKLAAFEKSLVERWKRIRVDETYSDRDYWIDVLNDINVPVEPSLVDNLVIETKKELYSYESALKVAKQLYDQGFINCILSNHGKDWFQTIFNSNPIFKEAFPFDDLVVVSCFYHCHKPEQQFYECMWSQITKRFKGVSKSRVLFFDDKLANVEAMKQFGIESVQYTSRTDNADKILDSIDSMASSNNSSSTPTTGAGGGAGGNNASTYLNFGLKIGFPPGFTMKYKSMRFPDYNITVREAITFITQKQTISKPELYVLQISYLASTETVAPIVSLTPQSSTPLGTSLSSSSGPGSLSNSLGSNPTTPQASPMVSRNSAANTPGAGASVGGGGGKFERRTKWMDDNVKLSAYPLSAPEIILELKKKYQLIKVVERGVVQTLVVDVTRPLSDFMEFITCKFKLDQSGHDYRLFHNNIELSFSKDIRSLNVDTTYPIFVRDKNDPSLFNVVDDPSLYIGDRDYDDGSNLSLEVPASSLTNILKEGYLKKQNRKKSWNSRYFMLTDKFLFYYKTPNDTKASGIINYKEHIIRVSGPVKNGILELIPKETWAIASASVHTHPGSFLIRFENENEMASWNITPFNFEISIPPSSTGISKSKSATSSVGKMVFGAPVEKSIAPGSDVPLIITQTIDYIEKKAMDVVGIFRLSGSVLTIEQWKKQYDRGERPNLFEETDPHAISGLLKLYLRELPEPLLTFDRYDKFIAAQSMDDLPSRLKLIKHLVKSLPPVNYAVLNKLMAFVGRVATHSANNKMQIHNLSTVFGPNLIREKNSTATTNVQNLVEDTPIINALALSLIRDYPYIFGDKEIPEQKIFAKTLYDYAGSDDSNPGEDLLFAQGVTIRVTQRGSDGWWMGEYQGKIGRFPATYVDLLPISPSSSMLLRTKSNSNLSKKKKFMLEMENAKTKVQENDKLLAQLAERKEKLKLNVATLLHEQSAISQDREAQRVLQVIKIVKTNNPSISTIPQSVDTLASRQEDYRKSHEALADVKKTLQTEFDAFVNNPKVKLEKKERENLQQKVDVLAAKLDDSKKTRNQSITSNRTISEGLNDIKFTLVL
ncbi:pleckstrin domain-containing protein [Cavenderia fasciculata]|uniref:Pleckstrin domain-containing protein n=1 Tax=Cavenderia fasciculata TaxID=261658 RepID=F4Q3P7_CACFS|nr:pleckstrin domain-containing protein [Cavenderia fasciculata]EGG16863.1 pleckstrin domain-containing protein [Cavenderia fasciculata]|eukprot:XP_004355337.1 pleckstrin domain-containing protein [Cavenderia fasciculata]